jgi:hypothetical protein
MAIHLNLFRIVADLFHTASKCILIWAIHSNKSAEGKQRSNQPDLQSLQPHLPTPIAPDLSFTNNIPFQESPS